MKKRSWKEDRRVIQNELFPAWRAVRATEIRRRDIRTLIEKVAERPARSMANRIQALIHKVFNFAIAHEIVEFNPCAQLEHPAKERPRDRVLTDAEIREFWSVLDHEPPDIAAAFRLRLITAQRGGEVHGMRWVDVDLDGRWWTIPGSVAKNGLAHRVPLSDLALEVLFALRDGQTAKSAASGYVLWAAARDPRRRCPALARLGLIDFRGHDLRRTAASRMASAGCSRLVIGKVLNHAEPGVTAVYDRYTTTRRSARRYRPGRAPCELFSTPIARAARLPDVAPYRLRRPHPGLRPVPPRTRDRLANSVRLDVPGRDLTVILGKAGATDRGLDPDASPGRGTGAVPPTGGFGTQPARHLGRQPPCASTAR